MQPKPSFSKPSSRPKPVANAFSGWRNLGVLFTIYMVSMGFVYYGFNVIFPEMVNTMGWSRGDAAWSQTLRGLLIGFSAPFVALTINKYGTKRTMLVGTFLLTFGCLLLGTVTKELWQWNFIWGVLMGLGFAFGGAIPVQTTILHWFDAKRSMAIGIAMSASGIGGFIAQPLQAWIIESSNSWQVSWQIATIFALLGMIFTFWLINKPEDIGQRIDGIQPEPNAADKSEPSVDSTPSIPTKSNAVVSKTYKTERNWSLKEALKTPVLWYIILIYQAQIMPLYMLVVHGSLHFTDLNYSRLDAASALSFLVAGSAFSRFPVGWLGDRVEPRRIIIALNICSALALTTLWQAPNLTSLLLMAPLFGIAVGGSIVMLPTMIGNYFGKESFASINGFVVPIQVIFSSMVPVLAGYVADRAGSYDWPFIALITLVVVTTVCAFAALPPKITQTQPPLKKDAAPSS